MTTVTLDLDAILSRLNKSLDFALSVHSPEIARDRAAVANFLARNCALLDVQHFASRANAVARYLDKEQRRYG